jgi:CBS domain-containing protein
MWDNNVGVVIVVDAERKPVSVVTDRDLAMAAYTQGIPLAHIGVGTCMSQSIVTCSLDADVGEVVRLMRRHRVRRIAVVDTSGQLAGIVGLSDLFGPSGAPKVGIKPADIVGLLAELLK